MLKVRKITKIIVQHFVENLLKVLKVLKTRTALTRNGLAEFRFAPHGRALKRLSNQRKELTNDKQNDKIQDKKRG